MHFGHGEATLGIAVVDVHRGDGRDARDGGAQRKVLRRGQTAHRNVLDNGIDARDHQRAGVPVRAGGVVKENLQLAIHGCGLEVRSTC